MTTALPLPYLIIGAGFLIGLMLVVLQMFARQYVETYEIRRRPQKKEAASSAAEAPKESLILGVCRSLGKLTLSLMPQLADKNTLTWLNQAAYRTPDHLSIYIGIKALTSISLVCLFLFLGMSSGNALAVVAALVAAFIGWTAPNFFLTGRVKDRQKQLLHELPTVIDLLIVCAQAGLGLLMCIEKVARETEFTCPVLAGELKQFLNDVKIFAKPSSQALMDMSERCGLDELSSVCSALIAAESKGSDISYPLRSQAEALRDKLKRKKEEEAARVPVKMVPVIVMFILPLILIPLLGPAAITVINAFSNK
jgi:tight adherence protein C